MTRRRFLKSWLTTALACLGLGLRRKPFPERMVIARPSTPTALGKKLLGTVPFQGEGDHPLDSLIGSGLGRRRAVDLARLTPSDPTTPNEAFFVRTGSPDRLPSTENWKIETRGLVSSAVDIDLEKEVLPLAVPMGVHLIECAGNDRGGHFGLMSAAEWTGVPVSTVLERLDILPRATAVLVSGYDEHATGDPGSTPGASWIFTFEQLRAAGAFFATAMNGQPLAREHGHPVRLVVPGWYGCCCIKWVNRIELVDDRAPATEHMKEFAGRTFQDAYGRLDLLLPKRDESFGPRLAKDYRPSTVDSAALPVRVEKWITDDRLTYRVVGILWGGASTTDALVIRFRPDAEYAPVESCHQETVRTWTLWTHAWRPETPGRYRIQVRIDDPAISTRRLDVGYYERRVDIEEV